MSKSDEDLIKEDVRVNIGTEITPEELATELKKESGISAYIDYGLDIDAVSQSLASLYKVEIKEVKVNGDKAVVTLTATVPTFGDEMIALVEEEANKLDMTNMTESEATKAAVDILNDIFTRPDYPVNTQVFDVSYVKKSGKWQMEDSDAVSQELDQIMGLS